MHAKSCNFLSTSHFGHFLAAPAAAGAAAVAAATLVVARTFIVVPAVSEKECLTSNAKLEGNAGKVPCFFAMVTATLM